MPVVYKIVSPSGKSYIGVAKRSAQDRFKKHCSDARTGRATALCNAIRKYGPDEMRVTTLIESTSEYCFDFEVKAIRAFETLHPNGYNLTTGGEGIHEMAEVSKAKHQASVSSPEAREAARIASKISQGTPEARARKSLEMKARWASKEWRKHWKKLVKAKKAEKEKLLGKDTGKTTEKICSICFALFECAPKVSSYKMYCSSACSNSARSKRMDRI